MTCATQASPPADTTSLLDALRRGDLSTAAQLIASEAFPREQLHALAEGLMRRRRWRDADWLFGQCERRDAGTEMKRCLSRNLAALQQHRPEVYRQLITLPATEDFGIAPAANGRPTILARRADGSAVSLSGGPDPLASARAALDQAKRATPNGESIALCGLGDGYLLQLIAHNPPDLFMDMEQAVFLLEPQ